MQVAVYFTDNRVETWDSIDTLAFIGWKEALGPIDPAGEQRLVLSPDTVRAVHVVSQPVSQPAVSLEPPTPVQPTSTGVAAQ